MADWGRIWESLRKGRLQEDSLYRVAMIVNQIGPLCKAVSYKHAYGYTKAPEWDAEIRISLADLLAMAYMMAFNEGFNIGELHELAQNRLLEFVRTRLPK